MASTDERALSDIKFFEEIFEHLPKDHKRLIESAKDAGILTTGLFDRGNLVEQAVAHSSGEYVVESINGADFSDGSEMKSCTAEIDTWKGRVRNRVCIRNISNKTGLIRALVYDVVKSKFRYFVIWDYPTNTKKSVIAIPLSDTASSKYLDGTCGIELCNFKAMAKFKNLKGEK